MTIKVTFEFDNNTAAAEFLLSLDAEVPAEEAPPKRGRGRRPKVEVAAPAGTPAAAAVGQPAAQSAPAAVPYSAVAEPLGELAEVDHGKAVAVLAGFGVTSAKQLKPEQYGAVAEAARKALGEARKPAPAVGLI